MEAAAWRRYRRHLIIRKRKALFGMRRFEVWDGSQLVGTFGTVVAAELCVDARLAGRG